MNNTIETYLYNSGKLSDYKDLKHQQYLLYKVFNKIIKSKNIELLFISLLSNKYNLTTESQNILKSLIKVLYSKTDQAKQFRKIIADLNKEGLTCLLPVFVEKNKFLNIKLSADEFKTLFKSSYIDLILKYKKQLSYYNPKILDEILYNDLIDRKIAQIPISKLDIAQAVITLLLALWGVFFIIACVCYLLEFNNMAEKITDKIATSSPLFMPLIFIAAKISEQLDPEQIQYDTVNKILQENKKQVSFILPGYKKTQVVDLLEENDSLKHDCPGKVYKV